MLSAVQELGAFAAAATVLTITPGLDTALMLRTATSEGPRRALLTGLGIVTGCFAWAAIVACGLSALLVASAVAYRILCWAGAGYLIYIGYKLIRYPRDSFAFEKCAQHHDHNAFLRGALTNLLNPKVGIFYVSFLPQFIPADAPVVAFTLLLGAIHAMLGAIWFLILIIALRPLTKWLRDKSVVRRLDRITGGVFLAFGLKLAIEARRTH